MVSLTITADDAPFARRLASTARPVLIHLPTSAAQSADPGTRPADTGVDDRIEISGTVLMRWAAKVHGLCLEEDLTDGTRLRLDAPLHWMSLAVALGFAFAGAELVEERADAALLTDPDHARGRELPLVLSPPRGLQPMHTAEVSVPADAVDLADALPTQPDLYDGDPEAVAPGLLLPRRPESESIVWESERCVALLTGAGLPPALSRDHVEAAVRAWHAGGSVTLRAD